MRRLVMAAFVMAATAAALTCQAHAQDYPWCANFHDGAGTNCGFSSAAQCQATILGSGGFCTFNTLYRPAAAAGAAAARKRAVRQVSDR